jgi:hypothetical protein
VKRDLKKFWRAVKRRKLTPEQEQEFSDWYHEEKARGRLGGKRDATEDELEEMLDEFLEE